MPEDHQKYPNLICNESPSGLNMKGLFFNTLSDTTKNSLGFSGSGCHTRFDRACAFRIFSGVYCQSSFPDRQDQMQRFNLDPSFTKKCGNPSLKRRALWHRGALTAEGWTCNPAVRIFWADFFFKALDK